MKTRPHPVHLAGAAWWVAFVVLVATLMIRHNDLTAVGERNVVLGAVASAIAGIVGPLWRWWRTAVELDGSRLRWAGGTLRASALDIELARAREVTVAERQPGRLLGYGRCRIVDEHGVAYALPPLGLEVVRAIAAKWSERPGGRRVRRDG